MQFEFFLFVLLFFKAISCAFSSLVVFIGLIVLNYNNRWSHEMHFQCRVLISCDGTCHHAGLVYKQEGAVGS